ncbi:MAG: hypothetical protein JKY27_13530, partial [Magnetovibrio sp.]|nr:hypothetical protein [Magnetovibrio sp.]
MRAFLHYLATMVIIPVYGIRVCPFIETLTPAQVAVPIIMILAGQFLVRGPLHKACCATIALKRQVKTVFWLELCLFTISALLIMAYNEIMYGFPFLESGLKVFIGVVGLGFFAATDIALEHERAIAKRVEKENITIEPDENYFPLTRKVSLFASISITVLVGVFMLLVIKDLEWLVRVGKTITLREAQISILKEFAFVLLVMLPQTLNIIHSYARNLNRILTHQTMVLTQVTLGKYDLRVPVASNDEFGIMAQHTNTMVERIKARTAELARTRDVTILSLATLAETRDN